MKILDSVFTVLCFIFAMTLSGADSDSEPIVKTGPDSEILADASLKRYASTLAYITETGHLWGIGGVKINSDSEVILTDATSGYGHGLNLVYQKEIKDRISLSAGKRCCVTDGRSCFIYYTVKRISDGKTEVHVLDIFDGRPLGRQLQRAEKIFWITPY